jgi:thiamine-phosphate pyrophosphorylase
MELMVISSPRCFEGESAFINALFEEGLEIFHMRKPETDKKDYARVLDGVSARYRNRIALNQHHELAGDFGTKRLHYSEQSRKAQDKDLLAELHQDNTLSTSIHDMNELSDLQDFDYVFMGPVFDSYSKPGYKGITTDYFKIGKSSQSIRQARDTKVIALGGISLNTIGRMKRMGFDGAAMLGWIWNDPSKAIENFKQVKYWINENT